MSRFPSALQVSQEAEAPSGCAVNTVDDTTVVCLKKKGVPDPIKGAANLKIKQVQRVTNRRAPSDLGKCVVAHLLRDCNAALGQAIL